jgi:meso-butanediol dehydrogenase/(S,S)-butanediol dehydrogenase/diacetyl reductase
MSDLAGTTAVVTGGAQGIGRAIANRFAADGADVVVGDLRDPADFGENQRWVHLDVTSEDSAEAFAKECGDAVGVLVNNAGIMFEASIAEQTVEQWDMAMAINLRGPWLMTKALLPQLTANGGAVVNIGSIEGIGSNPLHTAYSASKGGVHSLTAAMAVDLGPMGVRCNAIAPGTTSIVCRTEIKRSRSSVSSTRSDTLATRPMWPGSLPFSPALMPGSCRVRSSWSTAPAPASSACRRACHPRPEFGNRPLVRSVGTA